MNFPTSPALNDTYSLGSKTWKWNGVAWDLQSTGLTSSHVVAALGFTPLNKAGDTMTGNLAFSGTGLRITGDLSNATHASRLLFQTSTTNAATSLGVIPNGTNTISRLFLYNNADPTNASYFHIGMVTDEARIWVGANGSGTNYPLVFQVGGSEAIRVATTKNFLIGTSVDDGANKLQVNGSATVSGNVGIGTSSNRNSTKLDVFGDISFGGHANYYGTLGYNAGAGYLELTSSDGGFKFIRRSGSVTSATLDPSGNLGLGVPPSAWASPFKAFDFSTTASLAGSAGGANLFNNAYFNGTNYIYKTSAAATRYLQGDAHYWYTAVSGAAGNAISFTQSLTLDTSSNLTAAGNVTAYSDERLKKDWSDLPADFVERLAEVKHGTYTRIDNGQRQAGVGAQSLRPLLPEVILEGEHLSVAYGNAAMVSAVELAKRVVRLEKALANLIGD